MNFTLGSDHAGYQLKEKIKEVLKEKNIAFEDKGPFSEESVDYPDFGHKVAESVQNEESNFGIAICGSGNGINMTVNKYPKVRGALCWTKEICELARQHNNANVLSIPARFISEKLALEIVEAFIKTDFEGGRHERRINKI
ncbi:ribose 5-phosphate isomerase B [bacterium]|jgi:ribose 5-phosphate isomerase B|nr:ribose 5-phosphate isomerase B [Flavobacteriales bacterium]MDA9304047.1 ribose 5-phosphate isomerase B [bacterium]MDC0015329.1 ribose 5-phosphate isomerase B [Flavobacteriales bacterium]